MSLDKEHESVIKKGFVIALLIILVLVFILGHFGCKPKDNPYQDSAIVTANKAYQDSLIAEHVRKDTVIAQLRRDDKASVQKQSDISKSHKPVYDKIKADTGLVSQFNYTLVLLAEADKHPIKRN